MNPPGRLPLEIGIPPCLRDHRFEGRCVLPAVEALRLLAGCVRSQQPDRDVRTLTDASFARFLFIGDEENRIAAHIDIETDEKEDLVAGLLTLVAASRGPAKRAKVHAQVCFPTKIMDFETMPFSEAFRLEGDPFAVSPARLYRELVPLGPAFQNICDDLYLTGQGAATRVFAAFHHEGPSPLGSPFPLDAAMHGACVWAQRYAGIVAFPVGFARRSIFRPIAAGQTCFARIVPIRTASEPLIFDLWLYSLQGVPYEAVLGLAMRDVSSGRLKPPAWIRSSEISAS
jgi:hypothetical protein